MQSQNSFSERIKRWDDIRRQQMSYAINLFIVLSVGTLAYETTLVLEENFSPRESWQRLSFLTSILLLGTAIIFGIALTIIRLFDFRLTAQKIRQEERGQNTSRLKSCSDFLGNITWCCFLAQAGTYAIGVSLLSMIILSLAFARFG